MVAAVEVAKSSKGEKRDEIDAIFVKYYQTVFRACSRMLRNEAAAEDATQETFLRAWAKIETLRNVASTKPWLMRIARNVCLDALRGSWFQHPQQFEEMQVEGEEIISAEDILLAPSNPFWEFAAKEFHERLETCFKKLKPGEREIIHLRYVLELSEGEAAQYLKILNLATRTRLFRVLHKLRDELEQIGYRHSRDFLRSSLQR